MKLFMPPPQEEVDANELYSWLQREMTGRINIPKNHVRQSGPNKLRRNGRLDRALEVLRQQGRIYSFQQGKTECIGLILLSLI